MGCGDVIYTATEMANCLSYEPNEADLISLTFRKPCQPSRKPFVGAAIRAPRLFERSPARDGQEIVDIPLKSGWLKIGTKNIWGESYFFVV